MYDPPSHFDSSNQFIIVGGEGRGGGEGGGFQ